MKTVRDLIEKYPSILNMRLYGLEFIKEDSLDCEIDNIIEENTEIEIPFQQMKELIEDFLSVDAEYEAISIKLVTDKNLVKLRVKNKTLFINDKHNDRRLRIKSVKNVCIELLYFICVDYEKFTEECLTKRNFDELKEFIEYLKERRIEND